MAVDIGVAIWLVIVGVGYAGALAADMVGAPILPIDLALPAYGLMLAAVALGLLYWRRPARPGHRPEGGTPHGG